MSAALGLLLLGDGRFPAGGHAHSAGVEAAVIDGRVVDEATLERFVQGRLVTTGLVDAALSAATLHRLATASSSEGVRDVLRQFDAEAHSRIPVPALREASRRLGRQLARAAARSWPASELVELADQLPHGGHHSVVLGCVGVAIGATPLDIARVSIHHTLMTPAQAGVRLLGLDPFGVAALVARLAPIAEDVAGSAAAAAERDGPPGELPAGTAPLADIAATEHARWAVRLFAT